jgi:hypothetical protein
MAIIDDFHCPWQCSYCETHQVVYVGDPEDLTIPDREAVRCYNCKRVEFLGDDLGEEAYAFLVDHGLPKDQSITEAVLLEHALIEDGQPIGSK